VQNQYEAAAEYQSTVHRTGHTRFPEQNRTELERKKKRSDWRKGSEGWGMSLFAQAPKRYHMGVT
jgi:hypothetical protein